MKKLIQLITFFILISLNAQEKSVPFFKNGEAQVVESFKDEAKWIRHDLWVETSFDSDGDGKMDRMHVDVTRPAQTEDGLKLPVVYETSPYYAGTAGLSTELFWDVKHELGQQPNPRKHIEVNRRGKRPIISNSQVRIWVPRGFVVIHSSSPGTGLSDGAPTVGGKNESLAPKAIIDWLNGRARGYTSREGNKEVIAYWSTGKVGMTGTSYNGTLPLAAATTGVEGLEAIIPIAPNTSYYHYYRSNGLVRSPGGYLGEDIDVLYDFPDPVSGFQFDVLNINITGAYGGITNLFDAISNSESSIIGFSFQGNQIPAGSGTLLKIEFSSITGPETFIDQESIFLSYPGGDAQYLAEVEGSNIIHEADCAGIYYNIIDILEGCNGVCGSGWIYDCLGNCISPNEIIDGEGIWDDCNGVCGGDAYLDCAGVCDNNVNNDIGHDYDQDGICDEIDICPGVEYYDFSGTLICLDAELPKELVLKQNFPNPFNPFTNIEFYLDKNQNIEIIIYDVKGRKIKTLVSEFMLSGTHLVVWNGKDDYGINVPSGIYIYQLLSPNITLSNKMILLR